LAWQLWVQKPSLLQECKDTYRLVRGVYREAFKQMYDRFIPYDQDTDDMLGSNLNQLLIPYDSTVHLTGSTTQNVQMDAPAPVQTATTAVEQVPSTAMVVVAVEGVANNVEPMSVDVSTLASFTPALDGGTGLSLFMEHDVTLPAPVVLEDVDRQQMAEQATIVDEQMAAHVTGGLLMSKTVHVEHGAHVTDNKTVDSVGEIELGQRTARSRFPKMTEKEEHLFSGNAENLIAAQQMRDKNVGVADLTPDQQKSFKEAVVSLKKHLFTVKRCQTAELHIERTEDVLPKKLSGEQKMQIALDAANYNDDCSSKPFSLLVDAFVKSEVTSKFKPRAVVNHGFMRLWGLAKAAAIFEDIMFHALPHACIKHCEKEAKMNALFRNCEGYVGMLENDMTAFEFGIHRDLKRAEQEILREIMKKLDLSSDNLDFCERVVDARDKCCTWTFRYRDHAGAECRASIKMPRPVRESGDRITSSGNFLQNLVAWLTLLVKPGHVDAAVQSLLRSKGKYFDYISARDGRKYTAYLAFEGDDTLGALNEKILLLNNGQLCDEFFNKYGWSAKLKVVNPVGYDQLKFVGYTALVKDNQMVTHGENVVMFPEIKKIFESKAWATTIIEEDAYWATIAIYATVMMNAFRFFEPMYAFFAAMRADAQSKGGKLKEVNGMLRDCYIKEHGDVGSDAEVLAFCPEPETLLDGGDDYYILANVHAGPFSAEEAANMAGLTTLEYNGRDLACFVPNSWLV